MGWRRIWWAGLAAAALLLMVGTVAAFQQDGPDQRFRSARRIIGDLNEHGLTCAEGSADLSPTDEPIAVNAETRCTVDGRQVRIVVVAAADRSARDRYLRWLTEQGGGGYFALGDSWGVGGDFGWLARRVQQALGGTACGLSTVDGVCAPLDAGRPGRTSPPPGVP